MSQADATTRFSDRVDHYINYRPSYPTAVLHTLQQEAGLAPAHTIADVGAGTGILSRLFLDNGNRVYGVEPNEPMRVAAARLLADYGGFTAVSGTAEATTLPAQSVDFVTAGQAFHWFDAKEARAEFQRILRPNGIVALVWNQRNFEGNPFMAAYEEILLGKTVDYDKVKQTNSYPDIDDFFGRSPRFYEFPNEQRFDLAGLRGRFLSSSYAPRPSDDGYAPALAQLQTLFNRYAKQGEVRFVYTTRLFFGPLT